MPDEPFVDYYQLMQISPSAELETIQRVYRMLGNRFHPENPHTGDAGRFARLTRAYETLSHRETRAVYDRAYHQHSAQTLSVFDLKEFELGIDGERNRRMGLLCVLYNRRRSHPEAAGLSLLDLENQTGFPREHLHFTLWRLKEADLIRQDEKTDFAISGLGAEYLEANLPAHQILYRLMKAAELGDFDRNEPGRSAHCTA